MSPPSQDDIWEDEKDFTLTPSQCESLFSECPSSQATSKQGGNIFAPSSPSEHGDKAPPIMRGGAREGPSCTAPYINTSGALYMIGGTKVPPPGAYTGSKGAPPYRVRVAVPPSGAYTGSKGALPIKVKEITKPAKSPHQMSAIPAPPTNEVKENKLPCKPASKQLTLPKSGSKSGSMIWTPFGLVPIPDAVDTEAASSHTKKGREKGGDRSSGKENMRGGADGNGTERGRDRNKKESRDRESKERRIKALEASNIQPGDDLCSPSKKLKSADDNSSPGLPVKAVSCTSGSEESKKISKLETGTRRYLDQQKGSKERNRHCQSKERHRDSESKERNRGGERNIKALEASNIQPDHDLSPPSKKLKADDITSPGPPVKAVSCNSDSEESNELPSPPYVHLTSGHAQLTGDKPHHHPQLSAEEEMASLGPLTTKSKFPLPSSHSEEDLSLKLDEIFNSGSSGLPSALPRPAKPLKPMVPGPAIESEDDISPVTSTSKLHRPNTKTKPKKPQRPRPPKNPFGHEIRDKTTGKLLDVDSVEFMKRYSRLGRYCPETEKQMTREFKKFIMYCEGYSAIGPDKVKAMLSSHLPDKEVADFMSKFVRDRFNETHYQKTGDIRPLDLPTMDRVFCQIALVLSDQTDYVVLGNPAFNEARASKITYMKDAKDKWQLGGLKGQAEALTRSEINMLLSSDCLSTYTPFGLISLLYIQLALYFLPRVRKELHNLRRGELVPVYNADGSPKCFCYVPMKALKRDQGDVSSTSDRASKVLKRAAALPCPAVKKVDMFHVWEEFSHHLDAIPFEGDRKYQRVFYMPKAARIRKKDTPFFGPRTMGIDAFDRILVETLFMVGIDTGDRNISNQSLRVSAHNLHELMGIPEQSTANQAGHASLKTQRVYKRCDWDAAGQTTGATQVFLHGVPVTKPNTNQVLMLNGEVKEPHSFMPEIVNEDPSTVHMRTLPIADQEVVLTMDTIPQTELLAKGIILDEEILNTDDTEEEQENADSFEDLQDRPTKFYHTVNTKAKKKRKSC